MVMVPTAVLISAPAKLEMGMLTPLMVTLWISLNPSGSDTVNVPVANSLLAAALEPAGKLDS